MNENEYKNEYTSGAQQPEQIDPQQPDFPVEHQPEAPTQAAAETQPEAPAQEQSSQNSYTQQSFTQSAPTENPQASQTDNGGFYHFTNETLPSQQASFGAGDWQEPGYTAGSVPPVQPPKKPKKKVNGKKILLGALAVLVAAAICFGAGYAGAQVVYQNTNRVVLQQVTSSDASSTADSSGTSDDTPAVSDGVLTSEQVAAKVEDSVVAITTEIMTTSNYWFGNYVTSGAGSGVIISEDGYILTAAHVINGASKVTVELRDGSTYQASITGSYVNGDIAVVKIDAQGLKAAEIADSDQVKQGAACYAVGNPEGRFSGSISDGIVSALNRTITVQIEDTSAQRGNSLYDMFYGGYSASYYNNVTLNVIQMTAAVSPGNSGGALFNDHGQLIGIVSAKSSDTDSEGLGFAIPSNTAMEIASQLIANGEYVAPSSGNDESNTDDDGVTQTTNKAILGITVTPLTSQTAAQYNMAPGVYVSSITVKSTEEAGLQVGDRIISVDDVMVSESTDVTDYLADKVPGDVVKLNVERSGRLVSVSVTLVENTNN